MNITAVDQQKNLFKIENILPDSLVQEILSTDWMAEPWDLMEWQEHWNRRKISDTPLLNRVDEYLNSILPAIGEACEIGVNQCHTIVWLDQPGLTVPPHLDNQGMPIAMQLYWNINDQNLGTEFYHDADGKSVRYKCPYTVNTGYLMLNNTLEQWHGMMHAIPEGTYRLCSYTYFGEYTDKYGDTVKPLPVERPEF